MNCREFRLIERTTKDGLHWSATAPVRRNISMLELAKTQCTGLSGSVTDNTTTLGRCVLGGKTSNSLAMPGFNLTVFESWRASFGANDNTFTVTPNGTIVIWLSFSNDFDIIQSNGRTYWTVCYPLQCFSSNVRTYSFGSVQSADAIRQRQWHRRR